ncbi:hypothetical protein GCM10009544_59390 [Streptomyces stramineus]|uniref:Uncharacterized protein n=1 Tax=Streptomyces stramineus TaxID=173861 RepID=A0ABP3L3S6_9ACTN
MGAGGDEETADRESERKGGAEGPGAYTGKHDASYGCSGQWGTVQPLAQRYRPLGQIETHTPRCTGVPTIRSAPPCATWCTNVPTHG